MERLKLAVKAAELREITAALAEVGYNRTHAARLLGISRRTLLNKLKDFNLNPPPYSGCAQPEV